MADSGFLLDSNVWVALTFTSHPGHEAAAAFVTQTAPTRPAVFCRSTQQSYLRLVTTPKLIEMYGATDMTNVVALDCLQRFLASPRVAFRDEINAVVPRWHELAALPSASPRVWMDAYLAAFALEIDAELVTLDKGFTQFRQSGLRLHLLAAV